MDDIEKHYYNALAEEDKHLDSCDVCRSKDRGRVFSPTPCPTGKELLQATSVLRNMNKPFKPTWTDRLGAAVAGICLAPFVILFMIFLVPGQIISYVVERVSLRWDKYNNHPFAYHYYGSGPLSGLNYLFYAAIFWGLAIPLGAWLTGLASK